MTIVIAAHGTRSEVGQRSTQRVAEEVRLASGREVRVGWIDLLEPTLAEVLDGLESPVVVPWLVGGGYHLLADVEKVAARYPGARVTAPLGESPALIEALADRLSLVESGGERSERLPLVEPGGERGERLSLVEPGGERSERLPLVEPGGERGERLSLVEPGGERSERLSLVEPGGERSERPVSKPLGTFPGEPAMVPTQFHRPVAMVWAGSSVPHARDRVDRIAARVAMATGRPVVPVPMSACEIAPEDAVAEVAREFGATPTVLSLLLAPGFFHDRARRLAPVVTAPIGAHPAVIAAVAKAAG